jgi:cysteinyl-tRNA synthetase
MKIEEFIEKHKPCDEAVAWLRSLPKRTTMSGAWEKCERIGWLRWAYTRAAKDFPKSDAIRDDLIAKGVEVMDGDPLGWDWKLDV